MSQLLLLGEVLPIVLDLVGLDSPLLSDDLGDLWVGEARVLGNDLSLMVLSVQYKGWRRRSVVSVLWETV